MIRERIKNETASLHKALEEQSYGNRIMSGMLTEAEYKHILRMNYETNAAFENTWAELGFELPDSLMLGQRRKTPSILQDMEALGMETPTLPALNFPSSSYAEFIGALYVFEGSTLGGAVILKQLKKNSNLEHISSYHFYDVYGERIGMLWKIFLDHLTQITNEKEVQACIDAANNTFGILKDHMQAYRAQH